MFKEMTLFAFPYDTSRMGIHSPYIIGIDDDGQCYIGGHKTSETDEIIHINGDDVTISSDVVYDRAMHFEGDSPSSKIIDRLLRGKRPNDFKLFEGVDAGMGNWGVCIGKHSVDVSK